MPNQCLGGITGAVRLNKLQSFLAILWSIWVTAGYPQNVLSCTQPFGTLDREMFYHFVQADVVFSALRSNYDSRTSYVIIGGVLQRSGAGIRILHNGKSPVHPQHRKASALRQVQRAHQLDNVVSLWCRRFLLVSPHRIAPRFSSTKPQHWWDCPQEEKRGSKWLVGFLPCVLVLEIGFVCVFLIAKSGHSLTKWSRNGMSLSLAWKWQETIFGLDKIISYGIKRNVVVLQYICLSLFSTLMLSGDPPNRC